jgi:hypothetical protein
MLGDAVVRDEGSARFAVPLERLVTTVAACALIPSRVVSERENNRIPIFDSNDKRIKTGNFSGARRASSSRWDSIWVLNL